MNKSIVKDWMPVILIWSCLLLLSVGRAVELPVLIMAILGIVQIVRQGKAVFWEGASRVFSILFLAYWIPILLSLPDAVDSENTLRVTLITWRLYFAGLYIISVIKTPLVMQRFLMLSTWLVLFWVVDAMFQAFYGADFFGFKYGSRLTGLFGEDNYKLAIVLACVSPFLYAYIKEKWSVLTQVVIFVGIVEVLLYSGTRAAWIGFSAVIFFYLVIQWVSSHRVPTKLALVFILLATSVIMSTYYTSTDFENKVDISLKGFSGDWNSVNEASSARLPIWDTAINVIQGNIINGVGARSFRYAYKDYAEKEDNYVSGKYGLMPTHPHQIILEIGSETGLFGLIGLVIIYILLFRIWLNASIENRKLMIPFALGVTAALFPINTHLAIYSSFWSQLVWWLIALYCASSAAGNQLETSKLK